MAETESNHQAAGERVHASLAQADARRRTRASSRRAWRAAPIVAGVSLVVAAVSRWTGWPAAVPLSVLATGMVGLAAYVYASRRRREISDAIAAGIDADAGFGGELRSASWFAARETRDAWAEFHLARAAERLRTTDWTRLYPSVREPRARIATAAMAIGAVALAITLPGRAGVGAHAFGSGVANLLDGHGLPAGETLSPELLKQLADLMAKAEAGLFANDAKNARVANLKDLLAHLDMLRDADALKALAREMQDGANDQTNPKSDAQKMKELADRAARAAALAKASPEVRQALQNLAENLASAARTDQEAKDAANQPGATPGAAQVGAGQANAAASMDQSSLQFSKDGDAAAGAGVMMMSDQGGSSKDGKPGFGASGGSDAKTNGGTMKGLEQALLKETIEASTDTAGENVTTEARRKTEHGQATVAFTHSASGAFDRSRAVPPPMVPEGRRTTLQTYFIRKQ